ncbi:TPA: hypothetical protein UM343_003062 [Stenotrophomonas maltophilia]|nr:hypothetical protein [Stenotrophomonas maltophilia]
MDVKAIMVRMSRNGLLRSTDWTQGEDCQLSPAAKLACAEYRQKLRDLPAQPDFPNAPWPTPPILPEGATGLDRAPLHS